jgi:hypothetical protein
MATPHHLRDNPVVRTALTRPITMLMVFASVMVLGVIAFLNIPLELIPSGAAAPFLSVEVPSRQKRCHCSISDEQSATAGAPAPR